MIKEINGVGMNVFAVDERERYMHLDIMSFVQRPDFNHFYDINRVGYKIDGAIGYRDGMSIGE